MEQTAPISSPTSSSRPSRYVPVTEDVSDIILDSFELRVLSLIGSLKRSCLRSSYSTDHEIELHDNDLS